MVRIGIELIIAYQLECVPGVEYDFTIFAFAGRGLETCLGELKDSILVETTQVISRRFVYRFESISCRAA